MITEIYTQPEQEWLIDNAVKVRAMMGGAQEAGESEAPATTSGISVVDEHWFIEQTDQAIRRYHPELRHRRGYAGEIGRDLLDVLKPYLRTTEPDTKTLLESSKAAEQPVGSALQKAYDAHKRDAKRTNFELCGCDYCEAFRSTPVRESVDEAAQQTGDWKATMELSTAVHGIIGYCDSLKPGNFVTAEWIQRLNDYYIPKIKAALDAFATLERKPQDHKAAFHRWWLSQPV